MMAEPEIKNLYNHFMDAWLTRIGSTDITKLNTPENTTNNTITLDRGAQVLTVQVRGVEGDKMVYIDIASMDNQYFISYNKPVIMYSANLLDLSNIRLKK
jgi:hypothetical protein